MAIRESYPLVHGSVQTTDTSVRCLRYLLTVLCDKEFLNLILPSNLEPVPQHTRHPKSQIYKISVCHGRFRDDGFSLSDAIHIHFISGQKYNVGTIRDSIFGIKQDVWCLYMITTVTYIFRWCVATTIEKNISIVVATLVCRTAKYGIHKPFKSTSSTWLFISCILGSEQIQTPTLYVCLKTGKFPCQNFCCGLSL